jgi:hypothetical protein
VRLRNAVKNNKKRDDNEVVAELGSMKRKATCADTQYMRTAIASRVLLVEPHTSRGSQSMLTAANPRLRTPNLIGQCQLAFVFLQEEGLLVDV